MTADSGYRLPAMSVTTFVFHDVAPEAVASGSNPDNPAGHSAMKDFDYSVFHPTEAPQEPQEPVPAEPETPSGGTSLPWILGGTGALLVIILLVVVLIVRKKNK